MESIHTLRHDDRCDTLTDLKEEDRLTVVCAISLNLLVLYSGTEVKVTLLSSVTSAVFSGFTFNKEKEESLLHLFYTVFEYCCLLSAWIFSSVVCQACQKQLTLCLLFLLPLAQIIIGWFWFYSHPGHRSLFVSPQPNGRSLLSASPPSETKEVLILERACQRNVLSTAAVYRSVIHRTLQTVQSQNGSFNDLYSE